MQFAYFIAMSPFIASVLKKISAFPQYLNYIVDCTTATLQGTVLTISPTKMVFIWKSGAVKAIFAPIWPDKGCDWRFFEQSITHESGLQKVAKIDTIRVDVWKGR